MSRPKKTSLATAIDLSEITPQSRDTAERFLKAVNEGLDCFTKAAKLWIELSPEDQSVIRGKMSGSLRVYLDRFPAIASNKLVPELITMKESSLKYVSELTIEDQKEALENKIEVVVNEEGETKKVELTELAKYAKQVVGFNGGKAIIRTARQQKNWLKKERNTAPKQQRKTITKIDRSDQLGYMIEDGKLYFDPDLVESLTDGSDIDDETRKRFIQLAKDLAQF